MISKTLIASVLLAVYASASAGNSGEFVVRPFVPGVGWAPATAAVVISPPAAVAPAPTAAAPVAAASGPSATASSIPAAEIDSRATELLKNMLNIAGQQPVRGLPSVDLSKLKSRQSHPSEAMWSNAFGLGLAYESGSMVHPIEKQRFEEISNTHISTAGKFDRRSLRRNNGPC
jgi:hypothetical protein